MQARADTRTAPQTRERLAVGLALLISVVSANIVATVLENGRESLQPSHLAIAQADPLMSPDP